MLPPIVVPTATEINNWNNLEEQPVVETVPRSVPVTDFIRYPCESDYDRIFSKKADVPASESLKILDQFLNSTETIDGYLAKFYAIRSKSKPLLVYIEKLKQ